MSIINFEPKPPPRKTDRLFGTAEDWHLNARVNWSHRSDWLYSDGFRKGAKALAKKVCEAGHDQHVLIYPIVYLYRHHCELVLKGITSSASDLLDRSLTDPEIEVLKRHSLRALWENLRPLLNLVCERIGHNAYPEEDLEGIDAYIQQLCDLDPDGQRFRYATVNIRDKAKDKKNARRTAQSLQPGLKYINVRLFDEKMEVLADYLDTTDGWFADLLQDKWEAESFYGS